MSVHLRLCGSTTTPTMISHSRQRGPKSGLNQRRRPSRLVLQVSTKVITAFQKAYPAIFFFQLQSISVPHLISRMLVELRSLSASPVRRPQLNRWLRTMNWPIPGILREFPFTLYNDCIYVTLSFRVGPHEILKLERITTNTTQNVLYKQVRWWYVSKLKFGL